MRCAAVWTLHAPAAAPGKGRRPTRVRLRPWRARPGPPALPRARCAPNARTQSCPGAPTLTLSNARARPEPRHRLRRRGPRTALPVNFSSSTSSVSRPPSSLSRACSSGDLIAPFAPARRRQAVLLARWALLRRYPPYHSHRTRWPLQEGPHGYLDPCHNRCASGV